MRDASFFGCSCGEPGVRVTQDLVDFCLSWGGADRKGRLWGIPDGCRQPKEFFDERFFVYRAVVVFVAFCECCGWLIGGSNTDGEHQGDEEVTKRLSQEPVSIFKRPLATVMMALLKIT